MSFSNLPYPRDLDRISSIAFSAPSDDMLLASSYDSSTLFFSCSKKSLIGEISSPGPVLDTVLTSSKMTFAGLLDGTVRYIDFENTKVSSPVVGSSANEDVSSGISHIKSAANNQLIAASYGGALLRIDARTHRVAETKTTGTKIFAMDASHDYVTLGKPQQTVEIYDLRNMASPVLTRTTGLRFQTTCVRHFLSGQGYALSSVDGRVSIEYFNESPEAQSAKYAFKCHRIKDSSLGIDTVYPVTGLSFHPHSETLFTAGADNTVCVWDWVRRKRMKVFRVDHEPHSTISHMDIDTSGNWLALGVSDNTHIRSASAAEISRGSGSLLIRQLSAQDSEPKKG